MGNLLGKRKHDDDDLDNEYEETLTEGLADPSLQHESDIDDQEERILEDDDDDLETKPMLKKRKVTSEETLTERLADPSLQHKSDIDQEETMEGLNNDDTPDFVEEEEAASLMKNTLFIGRLSHRANIQDIIDFFKGVVHVRLGMRQDGRHAGYGFLEFASDNEAKEALEQKNGELLLHRKITLDVVQKIYPLPKYCLDHKVSYQEDCLGREEDETPAAEGEVLFVANLSPQTKISDIKNFFLDVGVVVVSVRLIVDHEGKHVGCGFLEFLYAYEAKKALEMKNGEYLHDHKISLMMKGHGETTSPNFAEEVAIRRTKTLSVAHLTPQTKISHIINFFRDVGQVVHVRLIANNKGKHVGKGFVEFASANEADKALQTKNGEYFQGGNILLKVAKMNPSSPPKYCIDHKVWYEDYLRQEEEDGAVEEGLAADYVVEEARKKTLFVSNLPSRVKTRQIISFFKDVGQVVGVRLIVDHMGKHVGCGFVEFASANEAEKALEHKNGRCHECFGKIFLDVAERAPYPIRLKYNLVEKLCYEDNILREPKKSDVIRFCGKKTTFSYDDY